MMTESLVLVVGIRFEKRWSDHSKVTVRLLAHKGEPQSCVKIAIAKRSEVFVAREAYWWYHLC